ncbi:unnamed protein product, partial [marine sediment metagenome]
MGRKIGFIPAAARLADPKREIPLLIILPESLSKDDYQGNLEFITEKVNEKLKKQGRCIVVVGEGVNVGDLGILRDSFGHAQFSASEKTVEQVITNYLNGINRKDNQGRGAIDELLDSKKINKIYGAKMGVLGILNEELIDISTQEAEQIDLLAETPSAGTIGSCRYKIKNNEDLARIV